MAFFEGIKMTGGYGSGPDIISSCSVNVNQGEIVSILGPNGAGKSTAMKAMLGLLDLKSGSVIINGQVCSIIGKISMGNFAVDTTDVIVSEGDVVEIFGENLSVSSIAKSINTIPYEIYSTLNRRLKRIYSDWNLL